ncbi:family 16 glycosylhydrolase [Marinoscillum furvescens]|uniref:Calx-beta domain-containing protein n=1 Tax=Marinoscillum furvescens DSM 4134 TaxID=1122208 RepID=A0A3D9L1Y5_MARFU|nr:family 16 glycosylhydrolase [Marinoscillum furvescens]RED97406.1 Calx-beta domain-containing protein [Marinoscillum furvescens DSM 4134]
MRNLLFLVGLLLITACQEENNETDPNIELTITNLSVTEGDENATIAVDVALSSEVSEEFTIIYETEDGTAVKGEDYIQTGGQIAFSSEVKRQSIFIDIIGDSEKEEDEIFTVKLLGIPNTIGYESDEAIITIMDDDEAASGSGELVIPTTGYTSPETYEGWKLVWQDEFNGEALNESDWTYEIGDGCPGLCGWGNNELEYYRKENTSIVDGNLVITAKQERFGNRGFTSSRIITKRKQSFQYGRIDIRAVLPKGQGLWPALWMLGANIDQVGWPACGEIDIMEMIGGNGRENTVHGTIHWSNAGSHANYGGSKKLSTGTLADQYHVYSIIWDSNKISWLLDGEVYHVADITPAELSEFHESFFLIFNVAVGGRWPGSPDATTVFPQYMIVDYIRVFQQQ